MTYQFKNFNYKLLKSAHSDDTVEVEVTFLADEKLVTRFFTFDKTNNVNYLSKAKAIIEQEKKNGKLNKYVNRYLHPKRAHIIQGAILGGVTLALLITGSYFLGRYLIGQRNDIVILYTNDVHGRFDANLTYASVAAMKQDLLKQGKDVILMDAGDHLSGSLYSIYDKGGTMSQLMSDAGYDVATLGNHEFDHGFARLDEIRNNVKYEYICSNLYHLENGVATTRYTDHASRIFKVANRKVGVVGISTPNTIASSSSTLFKDENGNYIYTFLDGHNGQDLYDNVQSEVDYLRGQGCNYVIALSHLGGEEKEGDVTLYSSDTVIKNTSGIDFLIDGHTHFTVPRNIVKNKDGQDVLVTQTGSYLNRVGKLTIATNGEIQSEFIDHYYRNDEVIAKKEIDYMKKVDEKYDQKIAHSDIDFNCTDLSNNNFGDLCADCFYYKALSDDKASKYPIDIAFVNRGGIRVDVAAGDWKMRTCRDVFAFDNMFIIRRIKGSLLKLGLEWGAREAPGYCGGFLPCAGLKYKIDTTVKTDFTIQEGMYVAGPLDGKERVKKDTIKIYNRKRQDWDDFDENKDYYVAGTNYVLLEGGDGASFYGPDNENIETVFEGTTDLDVYADFQVLANYVKSFDKNGDYPEICTANSPLKDLTNFGIDYEDNAKGGERVKLLPEPQL